MGACGDARWANDGEQPFLVVEQVLDGEEALALFGAALADCQEP